MTAAQPLRTIQDDDPEERCYDVLGMTTLKVGDEFKAVKEGGVRRIVATYRVTSVITAKDGSRFVNTVNVKSGKERHFNRISLYDFRVHA